MMKRQLITIHGINSDGKWQEMVECIFGPHFEYAPIKYPHYRYLGAIKLVLHPTLSGLLILSAILFRSSRLSLVQITLLILAGIVICHFAARRIRSKALNYVDQQLAASQTFRPPHLVAHSLGTFLIGSLLERCPDLSFDRMILVGCVLPVDYDWARLNAGGRRLCKQIRNEVGRKDLVVWLAFFLRGWLGMFGHSGLSGFRKRKGTVHSLRTPYEICEQCRPSQRALVHNVPHLEVGHGDLFITPRYCDRFWFPYLLRVEPIEYMDFGLVCLEAASLEEEDPEDELPSVIALFYEKRFNWCKGTVAQSLGHRVRKLAGNNLPGVQLERVVKYAIKHSWRLFTAARSYQCQRLRTWVRENQLMENGWLTQFSQHIGFDEALLELKLSFQPSQLGQVLMNLNPHRLLDSAAVAAIVEAVEKHELASSRPTS